MRMAENDFGEGVYDQKEEEGKGREQGKINGGKGHGENREGRVEGRKVTGKRKHAAQYVAVSTQ